MKLRLVSLKLKSLDFSGFIVLSLTIMVYCTRRLLLIYGNHCVKVLLTLHFRFICYQFILLLVH